MTRHYLDHASTSPLRPAAVAAMVGWWEAGSSGDPGRIHHEGMTARVAIEQARERIAEFLGARPREVILTSGATESIAAACHGAAARGRHSVVAGVEHSAVREGAGRGPETLVPVDRTGRIDAAAVRDAVRDDTGLVHCQWANHEVATIQPLDEIVAAVDGRALVHCDAAAAVGHVAVDFSSSGADLLSVSAHKFGGPTGVGALLVRRGLRLDPLLVGGDQERARRAGMENVAAILGFAATCDEVASRADTESTDARRRTDRIVEWAGGFDGVEVIGDAEQRLPHLVCLAIDGVEPQAVLLGLDAAGIAVHSGSSCSSESIEPSPVLEAMGVDAQRSLRVSVGWSSADDDVDALLSTLPRVIADLRALRG